MKWENTNIFLDNAIETGSGTPNKSDLIHEENEQKRLLQLRNFQGYKGNDNKTIYRNIMSDFGRLLTGDEKAGIVRTILTDNCEIFLFNFAETVPAQYAFRHEGFIKLFEGKRVVRREVRETYVSLSNTTGFQICDCEVVDESKGSNKCQFSFEVFSFEGNKVSKIRSSYGSMSMSYNPSSLFIPTKKERMLTKIKELNYAWADQPNLEKIASLMHERTEYKIWRWEDKKCFVFDKNKFASEFKKSLEEDFTITSVVPYGVSSEAQYLFGSYVYHLESKHQLSGQKFIWVSTCIYTFDQDCNLKKMSQQGELYPENETLVPFQSQSVEELTKTLQPPTVDPEAGLSIFEAEMIKFSFDLIVFGVDNSLFSGHIKGLSQLDMLEKLVNNEEQIKEKPKHMDTFYDIDDAIYDTAIIIESTKGTINKGGHPLQGKLISFYTILKVSFENGKLAKVLLFPCPIPDPIPSPFNDSSYKDLNFRPKSEFE